MSDKFKAAHWSRVSAASWPWENFRPAEMASKGDGSLVLDIDAMDRLQALRTHLGRPMLITSAYRDPAHNRRVGGAKSSYHMKGQAFDVRMDNHNPAEFEAAARAIGFTGFGYYPDSGFMHIDTGPARSWGTPFPSRSTRFAPEPEPKRVQKAAAEGTGVAAVAVAAERVVTEAAPMLPDAAVSWAFTVLAIVGLGLVAWRAIRAGQE
ncbi:D-Ala-D-Ala carboxypeptidase family metallohydrolase [Limimaricola variabilis]|uniref:YcbK family protein n=1 Tax=Limimaricola variabilis TaxID=1492771 RepID=UPI002AC935F6|nr:D-Ala-D-Ala carboxypeptidase family metallohydrolase [Limimaricola variabilis]WPY95612.1 D-Ala-D-Ala carboxypeptidase family metallohydrolase [Limimaricola variabilis]